ncbi:protein arginine kinase [Macrococcoides canis]|uniref:Protein-arginine kinase n=1 Tax=Macrococcoides canis TaxID=1855823 RepID=A0A1W7AEH5_9STAP|nr:protein arginine kinase [Macrococcus canis]ARQ08015.1 Putative ATP:guanido phosphotransferase [Macrococcus canis]MCO4097315.1 protein arginine kinase [Macrococcus canis]QCT75730.1 protein arginine kinase [Macrococcus canis]QIH76955.1 protein arginine kinase [Macrococcus canis]QTQ08029.1 protein arginine kinase [Macrococcus canis]
MLSKHLQSELSDWMQSGKDEPVILSSRIRLARNLENFVHPMMFSEGDAERVIETVGSVLHDYEEIKMSTISEQQRLMLVAKHLMSKELLNNDGGAVYINDDESESIMINEEDHIRIQVLGKDLSLQKLYTRAQDIDKRLDEKLMIAFDEHYGYLTTCPTNIGTGLRASVMLHLPGLSIMNRMNRIAQAINRFGFTIRGIYGEGTQALGHIYQVSNQLTLGKDEVSIIDDLQQVVEQIIEEELNMRKRMNNYDHIETIDRIYRSLGILKYSRKISVEEASLRLSEVKLGIDMGILDIPFRFNELMVAIQAPFLNTVYDTQVTVEEKRAEMLRTHL